MIPNAFARAVPTPGTDPVPPRLTIGFVALGGLGGSTRVAADVAAGLAAIGHRALLMTCADPPWLARVGREITHVRLGGPASPRPADPAWVDPLATALVEAVLRHRIDVLSVHYGVGLLSAAVVARDRLAARGVSLRVCGTLHGTDVTGYEGAQAQELAAAIEACDAVTAVSSWLADRALEQLGLPARPTVILNGVDTQLFHPTARVPEPPFVLCHASNFRPVKRPLDCLDVLHGLLVRGLPSRLRMIGEGPLLPQARARAAELGIEAHVDFEGSMSPVEVSERLRTSDLVLVTSASESFGLVALEAMASGVPVVGTRCGGLQELLPAESAVELLGEPGDVADLVRRAAALLDSTARYAAVRERCLAIARTRFGRGMQVHAYHELFTRLGASP